MPAKTTSEIRIRKRFILLPRKGLKLPLPVSNDGSNEFVSPQFDLLGVRGLVTALVCSDDESKRSDQSGDKSPHSKATVVLTQIYWRHRVIHPKRLLASCW